MSSVLIILIYEVRTVYSTYVYDRVYDTAFVITSCHPWKWPKIGDTLCSTVIYIELSREWLCFRGEFAVLLQNFAMLSRKSIQRKRERNQNFIVGKLQILKNSSSIFKLPKRAGQ